MELTKSAEQLTSSLTVSCAVEIFQDLHQKIYTLVSLQRHEFNLKCSWIFFFFPCCYSVPLLEYLAT